MVGGAVSYDYRSDPILGRALAYWSAKCGARSMPSRRDLDPVLEVPALLPNLQLVDIVGSRFRFRLIGSELVYAFGRDYTGLFVDELFEDQRAKDIGSVYSGVRDAGQSIFMRSHYFSTRDADLVANRLYLPLSDNDRDVNMIFGAITFDFGEIARSSGAWGLSANLTASHVELVPSAA